MAMMRVIMVSSEYPQVAVSPLNVERKNRLLEVVQGLEDCISDLIDSYRYEYSSFTVGGVGSNRIFDDHLLRLLSVARKYIKNLS